MTLEEVKESLLRMPQDDPFYVSLLAYVNFQLAVRGYIREPAPMYAVYAPDSPEPLTDNVMN